MKKIFALLMMMVSVYFVQAQMPSMGGGTQSAPNMGRVYGKIVDSAGKPVSDISVLMMQSKFDTVTKKRREILLKGITTKSNGEFEFNDLPMSGLKLKISGSGFVPVEQSVSFQMKMEASAAPKTGGTAAGMGLMNNPFDKDLGRIILKRDVKQLSEVVVVASKPGMKMDIDRKVFNVEKNITSAGGTAVDVMKNVPSVQVDIDGNVAVRNAAPQIMVDGRPTTLTLDQIPADVIESVEVITNPSAKFDASGGNAGIINIVLKKNKKSGYNGSVRTGADTRGGANLGGDINLRQDKFNVFASINANKMSSISEGTTDRLNLQQVPQTQVDQYTDGKFKGLFLFGRAGVDYFINNQTTISVSGVRMHGEMKPSETSDIYVDSLFASGIESGYVQRISNTSRIFDNTGLQAGMKHLFAKAGEELTADFNYNSSKNSNNALYDNYNYGKDGSSTPVMSQQKIEGNGEMKNFTTQVDYVRPLSEKTKFETGVRAALRTQKNNNANGYVDQSSGEFIKNPNATSNYVIHDNVYAAYVSVKSSIGKNFGYIAGLRAESSLYSSELTTTGDYFEKTYPISLFPSLFLSQKFKDKQDLQFNYSRRINRPNFFQLMPITDYSDPLNISRGNPNLVPEFTNSLEMSYSKGFKGANSLLVSAYYKQSDDLITRYQTKEYDAALNQEVVINTFKNANSSRTFGLEATTIDAIAKWWDLTWNVNVYNAKINTENLGQESQDAQWSVFSKLNNTFKLPKDFSIQVSTAYQSKTVQTPSGGSGGMDGGPMGGSQSAAQGYIEPYFWMDLAVKKNLLKNKASLTLSMNDVFRTRKITQYSESDYFTQTTYRMRDAQTIRLMFTYRFGKMDMSLFKRKNMRSEGSGMEMMQQ